MTLLIIGALGVLAYGPIVYFLKRDDRRERAQYEPAHTSRPGPPPAGVRSPGLERRQAATMRRSPGNKWLRASRTTGTVRGAARWVGWARRGRSVPRRWPAAIRSWWVWHRPRRPLSTEDRITVAVISQMHHEDTGGFAAAVTNVPGRVTPAKNRVAAGGDQHHAIAHACLSGEPGHPAGDLAPGPEPIRAHGREPAAIRLSTSRLVPPADRHDVTAQALAAVGQRAAELAQLAEMPLDDYMTGLPGYEHDTGWFSAIEDPVLAGGA